MTPGSSNRTAQTMPLAVGRRRREREVAAIAASRPPGSDIFTGFVPIDWVFVVLLYVLLLYAILQVGLAIFRPAEFDFDFMPLINGSLFIGVIWGATRLDRQMRTFFRQVDGGRIVPFASPADREQVLASLQAVSRRYGIIGALLTGASMIGGTVSYLGIFSGAQVDWSGMAFRNPVSTETVSFFNAAMIMLVCVPVGALAGRFLGQMVANGRLLEQLNGLGYDLKSFVGPRGTAALNTLESIYAYAAKSTMVLCAVLGGWWIAFEMRMPATESYRDWKLPFAWLWAISVLSFVFAAYRPVESFRQRLSQIYGGQEALRYVRTQLELAVDDRMADRARIASVTNRTERRRLERRLSDLDGFISALELRTFRRPVLNRMVLRAWLLINGGAFVAPFLWALLFNPGNEPQVLPGQPPTKQQDPTSLPSRQQNQQLGPGTQNMPSEGQTQQGTIDQRPNQQRDAPIQREAPDPQSPRQNQGSDQQATPATRFRQQTQDPNQQAEPTPLTQQNNETNSDELPRGSPIGAPRRANGL